MASRAVKSVACAATAEAPVLPPVPPKSLLDRRYDQLVKRLTVIYASHPDAAAFTEEYRNTLARCCASKVSYGTSFSPDIEVNLERLNSLPSSIS